MCLLPVGGRHANGPGRLCDGASGRGEASRGITAMILNAQAEPDRDEATIRQVGGQGGLAVDGILARPLGLTTRASSFNRQLRARPP